MKTISIIIPVFNQAEYLPDAIESVLAQTVKPHEIVVVDDGSTDASAEIASKYEGVRLIRQCNKGLASARNTGLMNISGDYVLPLDSDDMFLENCIEAISHVIETTGADIVAPSFKQFGIWQNTITLMPNPQPKDWAVANRIGYFSAYRREKALAIGGYSPRMTWGYEDYHFWIDMVKHGATIAVIEEPLVLYRTRENSMITVAQQHHEELIRQIFKDHPEIYAPSA